MLVTACEILVLSSSQFPREMKIITPGCGRWNSKMAPKMATTWYTCTFSRLSSQTSCIWFGLCSFLAVWLRQMCFASLILSFLICIYNSEGDVEWRRLTPYSLPFYMDGWLQCCLVFVQPHITELLKSEVARGLGWGKADSFGRHSHSST